MRSRSFVKLSIAALTLGGVLVPADGHGFNPDVANTIAEFGGGVRGVTVGPIENALHVHRGYGTDAAAATMVQVRALGGNWVSITPFGRIWDLSPQGIDQAFEQPFHQNRQAVRRTITMAHEQGLKVMLVPHLWVEKGGWRGEISLATDAEWQTWAQAYQRFVTRWAQVAEGSDVELFSVGVELRSWVTSPRAPSFLDVIAAVRAEYSGRLTYAANWDDARVTPIWGALDVIGINAFYPLAPQAGAPWPELLKSSQRVADELEAWASDWGKPVLFTEVGYTARPDPTLRPWEWPEDLHDVSFDPEAQAEAYRALLHPFVERPWFMGFFVWRFYADPYDASQEPQWGFSPLHKPAELALRQIFNSRWASDSWRFERSPLRKLPFRIGEY